MTVGYITDLHHRDDIAQQLWTLGDDQYRQFSTAEARLTAAVAVFNAASAEYMILGGDMIDGHGLNYAGTDANRKTAVEARMDDLIVITDTFNGEVIWVYGNHEASAWTAANSVDLTPADFWTKVDTGSNPVTRANEWNGDGDGTLGYTFEAGGIRYVIIYASGSGDLESPGDVEERTWLNGTALNTTLPVVVISHATLTDVPNAYGVVDNFATIRGDLEAAGNVQLVIQGHYHRNSIRHFSDPFETINDILYVSGRGSVLGASDGNSSATATIVDSAYYLFDIKPNAYLGGSQAKANVTVTGYEQGTGKFQDTFKI